MRKLVEGYKNFQDWVMPEKSALYKELADGQSPSVLFITCCDSRVQPLDFTGTDAGDIFVERCLGNIVPDLDGGDPQLNAIIEYALVALKVRDLVVCGHSGCGAMRGLLDPESLKEMPAVASWLEHAQETLEVVHRKYPDLKGDKLLDAVVHENVVVMVQRLKRMPLVADRLAAGTLDVHGWVFEISRGRVTMFDPDSLAYIDLRDAAERAEI